MQHGKSATIRAVAVLAILLWANLVTAQSQEPITVQSEAAQAAEDRIRGILQKPYTAKFDKTPLAEALAGIARSTGLPIQLDAKALTEASIDIDSPASCDAAGVPLHAALRLMLDRLELAWTIHDQRVLVTTPEKAGSLLIIKVYPVLDLAILSDGRNPATNYQPLVDLIKSAIAPTTWDEFGGSGWIDPFAPSGSLVISQTFDAHEQIPLLLAKLRQARDVQHITADAPRHRRHASRHHREREPERAESAGPPPYHIVPPPNVGMGGGMF
jgi:hypothetical protein